MWKTYLSIVLSADKLVNQTVPRSLSKPVYLHNIVCSSKNLALLDCSFTRYSGKIHDIQDVIVNCQERKYLLYFVSIGILMTCSWYNTFAHMHIATNL